MRKVIIHTLNFNLRSVALPKASLTKRDAKNNSALTVAYAHPQAINAKKDSLKILDSILELLASTRRKIPIPFNSQCRRQYILSWP